jgi:hypothetical protein
MTTTAQTIELSYHQPTSTGPPAVGGHIRPDGVNGRSNSSPDYLQAIAVVSSIN